MDPLAQLSFEKQMKKKAMYKFINNDVWKFNII